MKLRDFARFVIAVVALLVAHSILFDIDDFDVTQFWVAGAMFAIIGAIRDVKESTQ